MPGQIGWDGGEGPNSSQENQQLPSSVSQFLAGGGRWLLQLVLSSLARLPATSATGQCGQSQARVQSFLVPLVPLSTGGNDTVLAVKSTPPRKTAVNFCVVGIHNNNN
ncbi:hypothetical protein Pcinc_043673 [Petrolisthes cinctipes]|uniref:Uncharacterized protein n=1 Tax=Petrolisthes cinctipes TaxID=88211 RepID=A0AAE1BIQ5_PETCI|nr:hypothetical protein Pcinc_043673 [Petrolisthes cinctipes]